MSTYLTANYVPYPLKKDSEDCVSSSADNDNSNDLLMLGVPLISAWSK